MIEAQHTRSRSLEGWNLRDFFGHFLLGGLQIVPILEPEPDFVTVAAQLADAQRHLRGDRLAFPKDFVQRLTRNAEQSCNLGLGLAERGKDVLAQDFAGMDGPQ